MRWFCKCTSVFITLSTKNGFVQKLNFLDMVELSFKYHWWLSVVDHRLETPELHNIYRIEMFEYIDMYLYFRQDIIF